MEKFLFILGKNWRLSLAEIDSYLQQPAFRGRIADYSSNVAIVEFDRPEMPLEQICKMMVLLGGVQKIGKMIDFIDRQTFEDAFPTDIENNRAGVYAGRRYLDNTLKDLIYQLFPEPTGKKVFFANSIYPESFDAPYYKILIVHFLQYLNKFLNVNLKEKGAKSAIYYKYPQKNIDEGTLNPIFPHHFIAYRLYEPYRAEILYCLTEDGMYFGQTWTVTDSNYHKKLDEERPHHEFQETIPPKFAKTLLSLLSLQTPLSHRKVLDPFCGAGTILQFALVQDIQIYGSDIDPKQIESTKANIEFTMSLHLGEGDKKFIDDHIIQSDIRDIHTKFKPESFDGIATEPFLLPFYKEAPENADADKLVKQNVVPVYQELMKQAYALLKPGSRIAVVAPIIVTKQKKRINIMLQTIAEEAGFKVIQLLDPARIADKSSETMKTERTGTKSLYDAGSKRIIREFFLFQKPSLKKKGK